MIKNKKNIGVKAPSIKRFDGHIGLAKSAIRRVENAKAPKDK